MTNASLLFEVLLHICKMRTGGDNGHYATNLYRLAKLGNSTSMRLLPEYLCLPILCFSLNLFSFSSTSTHNDKVLHIFPKAEVAANKNAHNFKHHFLVQFFILFHLVPSILNGVLAFKTAEQ